MGHNEHYMQVKQQGKASTHVTCVSSAPLSRWTSLTKPKFKDKIIGNFKTADSRAVNQARGPSEHGVPWDGTGHLIKPVMLPLFWKVGSDCFK